VYSTLAFSFSLCLSLSLFFSLLFSSLLSLLSARRANAVTTTVKSTCKIARGHCDSSRERSGGSLGGVLKFARSRRDCRLFPSEGTDDEQRTAIRGSVLFRGDRMESLSRTLSCTRDDDSCIPDVRKRASHREGVPPSSFRVFETAEDCRR